MVKFRLRSRQLKTGPQIPARPRPAPKPSEPGLSAIDTRKLDQYRREIIKAGARKYRVAAIITPQKIFVWSLAILLAATLSYIGLVSWLVYGQQSDSDFTYSSTRVLPLPVARVGSHFIGYHDYLTELRRHQHYYSVQQQLNLNQPANSDLLKDIKQQSLQKVVDQVYIDKLARQHQIKVSQDQIQAEFDLLRRQKKLGLNNQETEAILNNFFGITISQYLDQVKNELLRQQVIARLDQSQARKRAESVLQQLRAGADFGQLAGQHSDDLISAANGGDYSYWLDLNQQNEEPRILEAAFATPVGAVSDIIETGYRLEIIKVLEQNDQGQRRAGHISFYYSKPETVMKAIKDRQPVKYYIDLIDSRPAESDSSD